MSSDLSGIEEGYEDVSGVWRPTSPETRTALLSAMRLASASSAMAPGARTRRVVGEAPLRCHLSPSLRTWGWAAQLYAVRSADSWGIGDFGDLRRLARWARELGAGGLLLNPLHAPVPREREDPSPYAPSSRQYRNPLYLRIEDVPGANEVSGEIADLASAGRGLNADRRIDRDAVRRLKQEALGRLWRRFRGDTRFEWYCAEEGQRLRTFATFATLAEHHAGPWHWWPDAYRHPASPAVERFAASHADEVRFHQWVQWLLDEQLGRAAAELPLVHDFPVGIDPDGADAWAWQDLIAAGARVGAPPDRYNPRGQDWGLPPFVPHRLRERAHEPFVDAVRAAFRHAGGLRIDHVMGLFRQFWVPLGLTPADGGYVRYPADDLLDIVALESQRARAFVVGEDLGTVERGVRERLAERLLLSSRVLWFESDRPERYPELAMASVTTHDLPTIAGVWTGADAEAQRALGLAVNADTFTALRRRLAELSGVPEGADVARIIEGTYQSLAAAPSRILIATLEDALAVEERPNLPGTMASQRPNWSIALPVPLEALETTSLARAIARALERRSP